MLVPELAWSPKAAGFSGDPVECYRTPGSSSSAQPGGGHGPPLLRATTAEPRENFASLAVTRRPPRGWVTPGAGRRLRSC